MGKWHDSIRHSQAASYADQLAASTTDLTVSGDSEAEDVAKARASIERIRWVLANCDPLLFPSSHLDGLRSHLESAVSHIANLQATGDMAYLGNLLSALDSALIHLAVAVIPAENAAPAEQIARLEESAASSIERLSASLAQWRANADAKISDVTTAADASITQWQTTSNDAVLSASQLATVVTSLQQQVTALSESVVALTAQWQGAFTQEQTDRSDQFRAALSKATTELDEHLASVKLQMTQWFEESQTEISEQLDLISKSRETAEEIVGIISDGALIGEPSRHAREERKSALIWTIITAFFGIVTVVVAGLQLADHSESDSSDWSGLALRVLFVLAIGGLAAFASRQATEHKSVQRTQEHLAIRLAAIKPFLRDIDETGRNLVIQQTADRLLAQPIRTAGDRDESNSDLPPGTYALIRAVMEFSRSSAKD